MKNIYMFQPNFLYSNSAHMPYAAGAVAAYALKNEQIKNACRLKKIYFLREDIDRVAGEVEDPYLAGFSTYVWNFEYNVALAKKIKEKYPSCIIVFGGHHVPPGEELLEKHGFIDVLVHGEGEEPFEGILLSSLGKSALGDVPNISYRRGGKPVSTEPKTYTSCEYPSPYLEGCFDSIFDEYPGLELTLLFETNRGCAYNCSYCDWGSLKSKLRRFPLERVFAEIDWACGHKLEFLGCADANFGLLPRDEIIVDRLTELKRTTGYPQKFQTSYAKNNTERIYNIGKKLNDANMNKGVTLAFQTLSRTASENVERTNISIGHYKELMAKYNEAQIPTYTELILGLPGETYASYADGLNELLKAGQHHALYIHNCEWLPCSVMGNRAYMEKYGIETTVIPLNQPHMEAPGEKEISEYSRIITKTYSMGNDDWVKMNLLSVVVQCFHHMNLLQFFALYLYHERGVEYIDFYEGLLSFMRDNPATVCGAAYTNLKKRLLDVVAGRGGLLAYDSVFGDITWPFEEYAYLKVVRELDRFYNEIPGFLSRFEIPDKLYQNLSDYQRRIIKTPGNKKAEIRLDYNLHEYFTGIFTGAGTKLEPRQCVLKIADDSGISGWEDYARKVVWFGRKESKNIYTAGVTVEGI